MLFAVGLPYSGGPSRHKRTVRSYWIVIVLCVLMLAVELNNLNTVTRAPQQEQQQHAFHPPDDNNRRLSQFAHAKNSTHNPKQRLEDAVPLAISPQLQQKDESKHHRPYILSCHEMTGLPILSTIGQGHRRVGYEVRLPNGKVAIAKRCLTEECRPHMQREAALFRELQEVYESQAVGFHGYCDYAFPSIGDGSNHTEMMLHIARNFSSGPTLLLERGEPLMANYSKQRKKYKFTSTDKQDLELIAQQYAHFPRGSILLAVPAFHTDNHFPQQYARFGGEGHIRHIDLEFTFRLGEVGHPHFFPLTLRDAINETIKSPVEDALEINRCVLLMIMARVKRWNNNGTFLHPFQYCIKHYKLKTYPFLKV